MCSYFSLKNPHSHPINQNPTMVLDEARKIRDMIGPGQQIVIGIAEPGGHESRIQLRQARAKFGFLPHWAKPDMKPQRNARSETVAEKPFFRTAFAKSRCLVPADSWYEWLHEGKKKTRYEVRKLNYEGFYFAGLYTSRPTPEGGEEWTFCIITTEASQDLQWLHDRMPVVIEADDVYTWLDPKTKPADLKALLKPSPVGTFQTEESPKGTR